MPVAIRFENVSKVYELGESQYSLRGAISSISHHLVFHRTKANEYRPNFWTLRNVSFEIVPGEVLGLVGPNGAGKTTTLKLLAKITQPTSGRIIVNGRISALIELGAGFHPDLTGRENIYLNAAILGLSRNEIAHRFDNIVEFSGLERFIDTPVKRYSSGMYVRLGFAIAAHVEPDILLVDEVLAVGDSQFRQRCTRRIDALRVLGTTIVFVSHNLPMVRSVCDRAIFLADGNIKAQGDVVEVINAYNEYEIHQRQRQPDVVSEKMPDYLDVVNPQIAEFTRIEIQSLNRNCTGELSPIDAVEVQIHILVRESIHKPKLTIRIIRSDGVTCCTIDTGILGYTLTDLYGQVIISFVINPLQLAAGRYVIDALLIGSLGGAPLAQYHSQWFQVAGSILSGEEWTGVFIPQVKLTRVETAGKVSL